MTNLRTVVINQIKLDFAERLFEHDQETFNILMSSKLIEILEVVYDEGCPHDSEGYVIFKTDTDYYKVDMHELEYGIINYPLDSLAKAQKKTKEVDYYDWDGQK